MQKNKPRARLRDPKAERDIPFAGMIDTLGVIFAMVFLLCLIAGLISV